MWLIFAVLSLVGFFAGVLVWRALAALCTEPRSISGALVEKEIWNLGCKFASTKLHPWPQNPRGQKGPILLCVRN